MLSLFRATTFLQIALIGGLGIQTAQAERRVGLVIGNAEYRHAAELKNPRNDAIDIAAALRTIGVHVVEGFDLDKAGMERKFREFASALSGADVGIFFYAGHGLQVNGINYLAPVDAELMTVASVELEMLRFDTIQRIMENEAKTNILFLDACRNNPLSRNLARAMGTRSASIGRGLASAESGAGTLISFSTQPGNVALDGVGRNSPYALALTRHLITPNRSISMALINVRNDVMAATGRKQIPWEHSALVTDFYFSRGSQGEISQPPKHQPPESKQARPSPYGKLDDQLRARIAQYIEWEFLQDREQYAELVDYYDKGPVNRSFIAEDKARYAQRWPFRTYTVQQGSLQFANSGPNEYSVSFSFDYIVRNGQKNIRGSGRTQVKLRLQNDRFIVFAVKAAIVSERYQR
jgi:hypothetical protein